MPVEPSHLHRSPYRIGVGIDFGTTNSSVAVFDGKELRMLDLDAVAEDPAVLPSALYMNREFYPRVGQRAIESYLEDNRGRRVQLEKEEVGGFLLSIGTMAGYFEDWVKVHAFTDTHLPSRLFRSVKTWLGDENLTTIQVFDRSLRIVALATPILRELRRQIEKNGFTQSLSFHLGRPVNYHGNSTKANEVALQRVEAACAYAGLSNPSFFPEPVAASLSFLNRYESQPGNTYLTFDFGGGTLDLCILRKTADGFRVLGTKGIELGGDDIDKLIYRRAIFPELGEGALVASKSVGDGEKDRFRFGEFAEGLLVWQHTHELNQNALRELIVHGMRENGCTKIKLARLLRLISLNLSFRVFQAIEKAKIELAPNPQSIITVPELDLRVPITRSELCQYMEDMLSDVHDGIQALLSSSGCGVEAVDTVICTGGSSRLPPVQDLLKRLFSQRLIEFDPFTGIAAGLAIANYHGYVDEPN